MSPPISVRERVMAAFTHHFGRQPALLARAPGRVNLIGEHTDYNDGFVLPMGIDRAAWLAVRPRSDERVHVYAHDLNDEATFDLNALDRAQRGWVAYIQGTLWALGEAGVPLVGWDGVLASNVPRGAGLSSSAAVELVVARAAVALAGTLWDAPRMAKVAQRAENEWVGMACGIMDQMASACARRDHALLLDCRSLAIEYVPLPRDVVTVVLDTGTRRGLVDSAYNERRAQCEAAAAFFGVSALRDVDEATFAARAHELDECTRRRARHVITENARTLAAAEALRNGDDKRMGDLMVASHASLRDDFEVSMPALDAMVECALDAPGCYGARMTGAGFGGCAVALVAADQAEAFCKQVVACYTARTSHTPQVYVCHAEDGADVEA
nr:galactokinase [Ardenticatena sp.]